MQIGIYIYDHAEVLDFSGPFEVFTTASRICRNSSPFNVFFVAQTGGTVSAREGFRVIPHFGFHNHPSMDLLMVPGGYHYEEIEKEAVLDWIGIQSARASHTASICSGAWLLARAGVITRENVTTHWEDIPELQAAYPQLRVHGDTRWIDGGRIITSAGISAGLDMSLHMVERFHSRELALRTARQMEYDWTEA